jgi:hypothetical protein
MSCILLAGIELAPKLLPAKLAEVNGSKKLAKKSKPS